MGLDISLVTTQRSFRAGSYGGFGHFRETLAESMGMRLNDMVGFGGTIEWIGDEPFYYLLDHSDCDGELYEVEELYNDFVKHKDKALSHAEEYGYTSFEDKYTTWLDVLKEAVETDGFLIFH